MAAHQAASGLDAGTTGPDTAMPRGGATPAGDARPGGDAPPTTGDRQGAGGTSGPGGTGGSGGKDGAGPNRPARSPWQLAGLLAVGLALVTSIVVIAFSWPTSSSEARNLPVVVAPAAAAGQVEQQLAAAGNADLLEITPVADEAAARAALQHRDALGAIVIGEQGPQVLKAGAASAMASQLFDRLAGMIAGDEPPAALDVVSPASGDPNGSAFGVAVLPMTLSGLLSGAVFGLLIRRPGPRLAGIAATVVLMGLAFTAILDDWMNLLGGNGFAQAGVFALMIAAVAVPISALAARFGPPAIAAGAVVFMMLGVPLAGVNAPWQVLPEFWGSLGQFLPAGAGGETLRRVAFFPDASIGFGVTVLLGWVVVGLAISLIGLRSADRSGPRPADRKALA